MGITSLQVCMDSSDVWLQQGPIPEDDGTGMGMGMGMETGMDNSSTPTGDEMLACSRPLMERRLRPQHEQSLKCPRCDSTHTKFCYYNNYSLSQPRYFCKTCRRYWTKGGTLRNIPVGGGCRKNKKVSSKKSSPSDIQSPSISSNNHHHATSSYNDANATDLHLAFPEQIQYSHLHASGGLYGTNPYSQLMDQCHMATPIDFMENKYEALLGTHGHDHFENFGYDQRLMLPYHHNLNNNNNELEVKPNARVLSLEWHEHQQQQQQQQQQACNSDGYNFGGLGSWTGLMSGYGSSAANPLV